MAVPKRVNQFDRTLAGIARTTEEADRKVKARTEAFSFALRNFLDVFYAARKAEKKTLLVDEPVRLRALLRDGGVADAYLAALANHLSSQYGLKRPKWSQSGDRLPDKPWFSMRTPEARIWLLTQSPAAFRERDLFISEDALTRV
ncbi:hypothetical protein BH09VER1_BH09VER1_43700 [soil metagenome]